jgi:hypothetical protein
MNESCSLFPPFSIFFQYLGLLVIENNQVSPLKIETGQMCTCVNIVLEKCKSTSIHNVFVNNESCPTSIICVSKSNLSDAPIPRMRRLYKYFPNRSYISSAEILNGRFRIKRARFASGGIFFTDLFMLTKDYSIL